MCLRSQLISCQAAFGEQNIELYLVDILLAPAPSLFIFHTVFGAVEMDPTSKVERQCSEEVCNEDARIREESYAHIIQSTMQGSQPSLTFQFSSFPATSWPSPPSFLRDISGSMSFLIKNTSSSAFSLYLIFLCLTFSICKMGLIFIVLPPCRVNGKITMTALNKTMETVSDA